MKNLKRPKISTKIPQKLNSPLQSFLSPLFSLNKPLTRPHIGFAFPVKEKGKFETRESKYRRVVFHRGLEQRMEALSEEKTSPGRVCEEDPVGRKVRKGFQQQRCLISCKV